MVQQGQIGLNFLRRIPLDAIKFLQRRLMQRHTKPDKNGVLAFVAGLKRATDEGSLPEIAQYSPYYLPLNVFTASKGSNLYILFTDW